MSEPQNLSFLKHPSPKPKSLKPVRHVRNRVKEKNPGIIYARISGYGQTGPFSEKPGYASVTEGYGGFRYINGEPGKAPVRPNISLGDTVAAIHAALGVALAIIERNKSGQGQVPALI